MKKFLSCCLVAVMLVSVFAVSASALSWTAGEGFIAFEGVSYSEKTEIGPSPVVYTDNGNSVDVKQGGYYDGANINAGVMTNEKVGLDGLEVTVDFKKAPIATNDCWFAIHLMQKPELFNTGKMAENMGYVNLIRFGDPKLEMYTETFGGVGSSEIGANDNMFAIKTGDKLTLKVRYEYGQYVMTYDHNGKIYEVPADKTLSHSENAFAEDGMAHVVVTGSLLGADNDWEYTVTVKEGVGISEEQKANAAFEKSKKVVLDEIVSYAAQIAQFEAVANSAVEGKDYSADEDIVAAFAAIETAKADVEAAKTALVEAADDAAVAAVKESAGAAVAVARNASASVEELSVFLGDEAEEAPAVDETDVEIAPEAEEGSMLPIIIAIIAVVIVVIAVVAVVLGKKKKN